MKRIILYITSIFILSACTEKMDVELDSTYIRLSVEADLTNDFKIHTVRLTESSDVFYNKEAKAISNAIVTINDGSTDFQFEEANPGIYESLSEFSGEEGKTYSLSISNVDIDNDGNMENYMAVSKMPNAYMVDSVKVNYDDNYQNDGESGSEYWLLSLYLKDDSNRDDYYGFACRINDVLVHDTITEVVIAEDTYFNGENSKGVEVGFFDQSKPDEVVQIRDEITLETYALTKDYYDFLEEFQFMDEEQSPMFGGPPANISSNISNGAVGFFAVYAITRTKIVVESE